MKLRLLLLLEEVVALFVQFTGCGKRNPLYRRHVRRRAGRKAAVTRSINRLNRSVDQLAGVIAERSMAAPGAGAADGNQAGAGVSGSFTPAPGQSASPTDREPYFDHESDAIQKVGR